MTQPLGDAGAEPIAVSDAFVDAPPTGKRALRILMIAPTPFFADRGCHVRILEEVRILQKMGHQVLVSTYHHGREVDGVETTRSVSIPWYQKLAPGPSIHKFYVDWFLVSSSLRTAETFRPDIVHAHLHEGIFVGQFVRKRHRCPMVADLQGSLAGEVADHSHHRLNRVVQELFGRAESWLTTLPDHIISSSSGFAEHVRQEFGIDRVTTLADAVDTERFRPHPSPEGLRAQLGIPRDRLVVVFLGVLTGYQGVDDLLEAARMVLQERSDVHFLIMGYPKVEEYAERATSMGLGKHVTFPGRIDYERAADHLSLGDVAVSAKLSRTEANGKLFNYMACGLPVVVYDSPINREILGNAGSYAPYGEQRALATELMGLLDNRDHRIQLGKALRQRAIDLFSWERAGQNLVRIYDGLLGA